MATLGSVAPGDQRPTRADGPSGLFSAPGDTSSKPPSLSVSQLFPLQGRTFATLGEAQLSSPAACGSNPAELQTTLSPLSPLCYLPVK